MQNSEGAAAPLVSVIIPSYNRAKKIERAVESVLRQSVQDFEIIIVDDNSSDGTKSVINSIKDNRISYLKHECNLGGSAARNTGIKSANGKYIAFLDSDDEWLDSKLKTQIEIMENNDLIKLGVVTCPTYTMYSGRKKMRAPKLESYSRGWIHQDLIRNQGVPWQTSSLLVRREALTEDKLFDASLPLAQDWDFLLRLSEDWQVESAQEPLVIRHLDKSGRISGSGKDLEASEIIIEKHRLEFEKEPGLLAHRYNRLAWRYFRVGEMKKCRSVARQALELDGSLFGPRLVLAFSAIPMLPISRLYKAKRLLRNGLQWIRY